MQPDAHTDSLSSLAFCLLGSRFTADEKNPAITHVIATEIEPDIAPEATALVERGVVAVSPFWLRYARCLVRCGGGMTYAVLHLMTHL